MTRLSTLLFGVIALMFTSCFKELSNDLNNIDNVTWNPKVALPLANGSFTIGEFAEELSGPNFITTTRDDGIVVFRYRQDRVASSTAEELVNIQDQNYQSSIKPSGTVLPQLPINGTVSEQTIHEFTVSSGLGDKIYSANFKGGSLDINLSGNFAASGQLVFTFPGLIQNGSPVKTSFTWTYAGSAIQQFQQSIDLTGAEVDFSKNGTTFNYFYFTSDLTLNYDGQAVSSTQALNLNMDIRAMQFSQATATISQRTVVSETNKFGFKFIKDLKRGYYYFDEPSINFLISNSFGVPLSVSIKQAIAHSNNRGDLNLTGSIVGKQNMIGYPNLSQQGQSVNTFVSVNAFNSNLPNIIAWQPDSISYSFEGIINPNGNTDIHFVLDTSRVSTNVELNLPMIGRFRNLTLTHRYDFDGSSLSDIDNALFHLYSSNGFPIDADLQLYFLNSNGTLIDSLITDNTRVLEAGLTDNNGKVTSPTENNIDVVLQADRLAAISNATYLLLRATLNTPQNDTKSVRIYAEDQLTIKLYAQTQFDVIL